MPAASRATGGDHLELAQAPRRRGVAPGTRTGRSPGGRGRRWNAARPSCRMRLRGPTRRAGQRQPAGARLGLRRRAADADRIVFLRLGAGRGAGSEARRAVVDRRRRRRRRRVRRSRGHVDSGRPARCQSGRVGDRGGAAVGARRPERVGDGRPVGARAVVEAPAVRERSPSGSTAEAANVNGDPTTPLPATR